MIYNTDPTDTVRLGQADCVLWLDFATVKARPAWNVWFECGGVKRLVAAVDLTNRAGCAGFLEFCDWAVGVVQSELNIAHVQGRLGLEGPPIIRIGDRFGPALPPPCVVRG